MWMRASSVRTTSIVLGIVGILGILSGRASAQSPSATPTPGELVLDVERHVDEVLTEQASKGTPRFETSIEVIGKSPQIMLERFFGGLDLECGPVGSAPRGGGAPTEMEMRQVRPHPAPYLDFATVGRLVAQKLKGKGPEKYFLYRVHTKNGVKYLLREGRVPPAWLQSLPGTTYDLIAAFPDLDSGVRGWKRMERGFETPVSPDAPPPQPWQTQTCRPRR
jgi:hypothetical protein